MYKQRIVLGLVVLSLFLSCSVYFFDEWHGVILNSNKHRPSKLCQECYPVQRNDDDHVELIPNMTYVSVERISRNLLRDRYIDIAVRLEKMSDLRKVDQTSLRKRLMTSSIEYEGFQYILGGHWKPTNTTTDKSKVALLIPFRNREKTIGIFLRHMVPFILRQQLEFGIFVVEQIGAEFMRITTRPLISSFMAELDRHTAKLLTLMRAKGGAQGQKIKRVMKVLDENQNVNIPVDTRREVVLLGLCAYLNEDSALLVQEYLVDSLKFNRGMLMNVGYLEALRFEDWDCIVIHDVDFIPRYDDTSYTCQNMPRHFLSGLAKRPKVFDFEFNGVTGFTVAQYREMNGAPNRYWGWGGEDHDLRTRAELMKYTIYRTKHPYGFYDHIPHVKHKKNETEEKWPKYNKEVKEYQFRDGLNNIKYAQPEVTIHPLYVHISVALSHLEVLPEKPRKKKHR